MNVTLLNFTPDPEKTVVLAAKLCYSDSSIGELEEKVRGISYEKFLGKILNMGHHSVLEHVSFTFGIEGISRATSHQLVRHRIASYSQQSQRYVAFDEGFEYVTPNSIASNTAIKKDFEKTINTINRVYKRLIDLGIPPEDARYILPNAAATKIIVTMNARELLHFFHLRCCERSQWEIRDMAARMLLLVREKAPIIFSKAGPGCVNKGRCTEGEFTCGKPDEIREKFRNLSINKNYV
ncbi:MAG: FAD-dependent thymidylate synthase [Deltaproteobacteria bacterium GWC2_42_11]|nr:MAG: FAD-dependent thymidylate synthase [Deltaproteobacteria bacterium GWC2_42_11]HBO84618.1 FAD-dependent thymidylate synthase [Deltaproteobacteria bacterium]